VSDDLATRRCQPGRSTRGHPRPLAQSRPRKDQAHARSDCACLRLPPCECWHRRNPRFVLTTTKRGRSPMQARAFCGSEQRMGGRWRWHFLRARRVWRPPGPQRSRLL